MPKVSVIMPTYNAEKYLCEAIDSILNQTFTDFEFLIIDDNSTDRTREIINTYTDPRIRLIDGPCKGIAAALNLGINEAKGEYIARMDADDISLPERFEKQIEYFENHPNVSILGSWQERFGGMTGIHMLPEKHEEIKVKMLFGCEMCHSTVMFKKRVFLKNNLFYNEKSPQEDFELWIRAIKKVRFANVPHVLSKYRKAHLDSITMHKTDVLNQYEAQLIREQLQDELGIYIKDSDVELLQRRYNPLLNKSYEEKIGYLKRFYKLVRLMLKKNSSIKMFDQQMLAKYFQSYYEMRINEAQLAYASKRVMKCIGMLELRKDILHYYLRFMGVNVVMAKTFIKKLQKIFCIKNERYHKVITILGLKVKINNKFKSLEDKANSLNNQLNSLKSDVFYDNLVEFKDLDVAGFKKYLGNDVSVVSANKPSCSELSYLSRLFKNLDITDIYSQISPPDFYIMWGQRFLDNNYRVLRAAKLYKKPLFVFEDGFIKSVASPYDKNADIEYRCNMSYTVNSSVAYFDGIEVSALEKMINNPEIIISEEEKKRARECIDKIVSNHITKYNHQPIFNPEIGRKGVKKILVIDQTYGDMSIVKGCANDNTFKYMLECAINENPDADIIVKTHPDTMLASQIKGYYTGLTQHDNIYPYTEAVNPIALINYCDEVYVCTSQMGFEALMCGKKVHTFGVSFYSQYGLTEDYQKCERRTVKRTLEEMFYIIYIMFSYYVLPEKEGKCEIEDVIDYVIQKREEFFNGKAQEAECIMK